MGLPLHHGILPMTSPIEWQALPEDVGERLDRAIATHIPDMSRSYAATLVDLGAVEVNGSLVSKTSYKLKAGDTIRVQLPAPQPSGLGSRQDQGRNVVQPCLDRKQKSAIRCYMPTLG